MVMDPANVKSATDNVGTFNGADTDIRYSLAPQGNADLEALRKLGLVPEEAKGVLEHLREARPGRLAGQAQGHEGPRQRGYFRQPGR